MHNKVKVAALLWNILSGWTMIYNRNRHTAGKPQSNSSTSRSFVKLCSADVLQDVES